MLGHEKIGTSLFRARKAHPALSRQRQITPSATIVAGKGPEASELVSEGLLLQEQEVALSSISSSEQCRPR